MITSMRTISDLVELLRNMRPVAEKTKYYIAAISKAQFMALSSYMGHIKCIFREKEGISIMFPEKIKDNVNILTKTAGPFACITLGVYSNLTAIGFLAKITETLSKNKISVNVVSAYYHDYLFVPYERKKDALRVLRKLQAR